MSSAPDFSIGRDWKVTVNDPAQGGIQTWGGITGFSKKQNTNRITSKKLDGRVQIFDQPETWEGELSFDREDASIDTYFAIREAGYFDGTAPNVQITLTETISERDGSISQFRYTGVSLTLNDAGGAKSDDKVSMSVNFVATRRLRVV